MEYIKYMPYKSIKNASRNRRELSVAAELGYNTIVFSNDDESSATDYYSGKLINDGTVKMPAKASRLKSILTIIRNRIIVYLNTYKLPVGVWSCHDLHSLKIAYFVSRFRVRRPVLVYDSHEFELGRNAKRNSLQKALIAFEERYLIKRCAFSIMVNDSIADEVQRIYKLKTRPIVVRSTPDYWELDESECKIKREEFIGVFNELGGAEDGQTDSPFFAMYHGVVIPERGIETLIELTRLNPNICSVILGNGSAEYMNRLKNMARELGVESRVIFHPAVPLSELWKYVGAVDLSLMMISGKAKSYYYALPNKFFESIQALTPIVASSFPEMKRIIDKYEIGLTCDPEDIHSVNECVEKMRTDRDFYIRCEENLHKAKSDLCWENEKHILEDAIRNNIRVLPT